MLTRLEDYKSSLAQTQASVKKLKAEIEVLKKAHEQTIGAAKAELDKARLDLKTATVVGAIDAERMRLTAEEAEARYKQLLAEVKYVDAGYKSQLRIAEYDEQQAELELKRAEANADRMVLRAAIPGLTVMQNTFRGSEFAQIQQGDQLWPGQPFMQIVDTSTMIINASVNQVDVDNLRIGAKAKVRFDAFPGLELPAHVYSIGAITKPGGMRANFVKEVPVRLKLDQMDPRIIPDLSVSADVIIAEEQQQATVVPLAAVFHEEGSRGAAFVFVKKESGWEKRKVELGLADNTSVAIRSGLGRGETVALETPLSYQENQKQES
jgi:multidrug resistance efflux pump